MLILKKEGKGLNQLFPIIFAGGIILLAAFYLIKGINTPEQSNDTPSTSTEDISSKDVAPSEGWLNGAKGFEEGLKQFEAAGNTQPMIVYFHAPWCPYCKRLNAQLLTTPEVTAQMKELIKVKVYPEEENKNDIELMNQFGATGYPSMFIKHPGEDNFSPLVPYNMETQQLNTPQEFVKKL